MHFLYLFYLQSINILVYIKWHCLRLFESIDLIDAHLTWNQACHDGILRPSREMREL